MPDPATVMVVAPNWLGDAVMALPAIADIRRHFPSTRLAAAARPGVADLFHMVPHIDIVVRAEPAAARGAGASVAILFPNSFASAWLMKRAGVPERWGYAGDLRSGLLTRTVRKPRTALHQGGYYQHLVRELGISTGPLEPILSVSSASMDDARALLAERGWNGESPIVALAPGAAYGTAKQWIPAHVARLMADLVRQGGFTCVLVGSRGDVATTSAVRAATSDACRSSIIDLAGATTLQALAAVLCLARACVSNDSGAMHLAAAAGVPVVALFGSTNEHATSPLTRSGGRAEVLINPVWCRPCMLRECPIDHRCMTGIEPQHVFEAVNRVADAHV